MTYGTGLITGAQIVEFTGIQDLANLTTDGELVLNTFAQRASDAIYRRLEGAGLTPALLTNENRLGDAVAYEAAERLALAGYFTGGTSADFAAKVSQALREFHPTYASGEEARNATEGVPSVGHADVGSVFSDDTVSDDLPTLL